MTKPIKNNTEYIKYNNKQKNKYSDPKTEEYTLQRKNIVELQHINVTGLWKAVEQQQASQAVSTSKALFSSKTPKPLTSHLAS